MKLKQFTTLLITGVLLFNLATPVLAAESKQTVVGFTKAANADYTLSIPADNTNIAKNGDFSSIGNLKVTSTSSFEESDQIVVTINRSTKLTNTDENLSENNKINYALYTGTEKNSEKIVEDGEMIPFTASNINAATPIPMGVAITGANYSSLLPGDYRDTITFTASYWKPYTINGSTSIEIMASEGAKWSSIVKQNSDKLDLNDGYVRQKGSSHYISLDGSEVEATHTFSFNNSYTFS